MSINGLSLSAFSCDSMSYVRESKSKLELLYRLFIDLFLSCFIGPKPKHMLERSLKLSLRIPK